MRRDPRLTRHGPNEELRTELVDLARDAGLLTFQAQRRFGGREPSHVEQAVLFEAAGWSTLGPIALNCAAPDEGNMFLLSKIANDDQVDEVPRSGDRRPATFGVRDDRTRRRGLGPQPVGHRGRVRRHRLRDQRPQVVDHRGQRRTDLDHHGARRRELLWALPGHGGPTLFLCDGKTPGIELERVMNTMDRNYVEGHGVVRFNDLRLPASAVLGEVGEALRYAQLRLAPARLTHCMRWLGAASRAQSIAVEHARTRTAFGKPLGEHQGVSFMIADNEIALQQCRLAIWWACWTLDSGAKGRHESSMVKAYVSEELFKVADRCVQILGGIGISDETPVGMIFSDIRAFRLYDGPTEVHKYAIARQVLRNPS